MNAARLNRIVKIARRRSIPDEVCVNLGKILMKMDLSIGIPADAKARGAWEREIIRRTNADLAADQPRVTLEDLRELIKEVSDVE